MQGDKFAQAATLQKACENRCGHRPQEYTVLNYQQGHVRSLGLNRPKGGCIQVRFYYIC
jgi:hypothetical protein